MAPNLKGVQKSTMTNQQRKLLCEYKRDHQGCTQQDLVQWVDKTFNLKVSQGTISNTLKRSSEFLSTEFDKSGSSKRKKPAKYPDMEKVVYEWFLQHQERVNITGELIIEKAIEALKLLYPHDLSEHKLSQGWLEKFKLRHGIKSCRRFGESGSVDTHDMEKTLESIRGKIDQFPMKDVFNMDESCFTSYKLTIHLQQNNLKVGNRTRKGLQLLFVAMRMARKKFLYGSLVSMQSHVVLKIST